MSNLASVTCPSLHILVKSETEVFLIFGFLVKSLINHNCHNSKTSYDIYMKLGPVTNLARRNTTTSKKLTMMSYRQIMTSSSFFRFMASLQQTGSRILDACSVILIFSLIVTFYLTKMETKIKYF